MAWRQGIPTSVKRARRAAIQRKVVFRRSLANARKAFHPGETLYRLAIADVDGFEVAYRQPSADESVLEHSFDRDIFFTGVPEYEPKPDDVVLDVGAHIGTFSLLAARKVPEGRVYAIEASLETFNYLRVNVALNGARNIDATHVALSDRTGTAKLSHDVGNWGHSIVAQLSSRYETIATESLQSFIARKGIKRIDFIKFNCEGAEFAILMGTPVALLRSVGMMLVLYHCDLAPSADLESLLARLHDAEFKTTIRNEDPLRGWIIATHEK